MDIVTIQSRAFKLEVNEFITIDLFDNLKAIIQTSAIDIDVCFNIDYDTMPKVIYGDMERIQTLIMHLFKNSLYRTGKVRKIGISSHVEKKKVVK